MRPVPSIRGGRSSKTLLYEGNFDEWQRRTSARFIANGRPTQAYPAISHIDDDEKRTIHYHKTTRGDMKLIDSRITLALLNRVPITLEVGVGQLYASLERLCKPFRLQDLPAELRIRIYEEAIYSKTTIGLMNSEYHIELKERVPALAQVSRQLRQEVLPVYYSINTFETEENNVQHALGDWKSRVLGSNVKFLSSFRTETYGEYDFQHGRRIDLHFRFDEVRGLQIECGNAILKPVSKKMIEKFTRDLQAEHEGQDLKGEFILLAAERFLEMDSYHWKYVLFGALQLERSD